MDRTGWRLGDPHPHRPAHGGLKGYNSLMFLLAFLIPRTGREDARPFLLKSSQVDAPLPKSDFILQPQIINYDHQE